MILDWLGTYYVDNAVIITNAGYVPSGGPQTASITEAGNAVDTKDGVVTRTASQTESGSALDTNDATKDPKTASITEACSALDTQDAASPPKTASITESASAGDFMSASLICGASIIESASATDIHDAEAAILQPEVGDITLVFIEDKISVNISELAVTCQQIDMDKITVDLDYQIIGVEIDM